MKEKEIRKIVKKAAQRTGFFFILAMAFGIALDVFINSRISMLTTVLMLVAHTILILVYSFVGSVLVSIFGQQKSEKNEKTG